MPITRYFQDILKRDSRVGFAEGAERIGLLLSHFEHTFVNGFDYICPRVVGAPESAKGPPPYFVFKLLTWFHPQMRRRLATAARTIENKSWREELALWESQIRPSSTRTHLDLQKTNPEALGSEQLAAYLQTLCATTPVINTIYIIASR